MKQRKLGALTVSAQGLGCMGMSFAYGSPDDTESVATLNRAIELGVTFWDTADIYGGGENEKLLARVLAERRDEVTIATKFAISIDAEGNRKIRGDAEYVRQACDASLQRLGTDHIDLYYQHRVDPDVAIEETVGAMAELVAAGKVLHLGLSEAGAATLRRAAAIHPIAALQSEWSLWTRELESEIVPTARELGIGVVPYSPLGRGMLTGTVTKDQLGSNDFRRTNPRFNDDNFDANRSLVATLEQLAEQHGASAGQLALAWVQHQGEDVVPIPGTKRRTYLESNAAALDIELSAEDIAAIEAAIPKDAVAGTRYAPDMMKMVAI